MDKWLRELALCFSAGAVGALAKSGAIWLCAQAAFSAGWVAYLLNAQYPRDLYARIVWGGVAGFLFLLPMMRKRWPLRGLFWGVVLAALQLVLVPLLTHGGFYFALAPALAALALALVWGLAAAFMLRLCGG